MTEDLSLIVANTLTAKVYEPEKRKHGTRHPTWQRHRFPIVGGISRSEVLRRTMADTSPLLAAIRRRVQD